MNTLKRIGFICLGMALVSLLYGAAINGWLDVPEMTVSTNPASGWWRLYFKNDGKLYKRNSSGTETELVDSASLAAKADKAGNIVTDATASRTLSGSDNGTVLVFTSGSAITVTVPVLTVGFNCLLIQRGAGTITVAASGTALYSEGSKVQSNAQNAPITVLYTATNAVQLGGSLK